jgi:hypothetical protein
VECMHYQLLLLSILGKGPTAVGAALISVFGGWWRFKVIAKRYLVGGE